jgi:ubiquinone biosynthesis protein COQ9
LKIYGRNQEDELEFSQETSIIGAPEALRELASFLYRCADAIEDEGEEWEHERFESSCMVSAAVIVFNPDLVEDDE